MLKQCLEYCRLCLHRLREVHTRLLNILRTLLTDCLRSFTGWGNKGFVVLLGFLQAVYSLEGCETAAQVAEEAKRAELLAPLAIVFSIVGSYIVGLAYMLALLFSVQSIPSVQATSYALPITQLYYDAVGPKLTLMCLTVVCCAQFMAAVTAFTASSRLIFALARDGAVGGPARVKFETLNRWQAPYWGIWLSVLVGCIISCAYIGSTIAVSISLHLFACTNWHHILTCRLPPVQCDTVVCCYRSHAELLGTHYHPCFLAQLVSYKTVTRHSQSS